MTSVFIDGSAGTTGLQIEERLKSRSDINLLKISDTDRKDTKIRHELINVAEVVFLCLPDAAAIEAVALCENSKTAIIDASTAHRVNPAWVYGFSEIHCQREKIARSKRIANPGCYASGFISLVRPLIDMGILSSNAKLSAHGLSGYTGGGKSAIAQYEDLERDFALNSPRNYALSLEHKHLKEMQAICNLNLKPIFTPVICDYPQGMLVTIPIHLDELEKNYSVADLNLAYGDYYVGSKIVKLVQENPEDKGFFAANSMAGYDGLEILVSGNSEQALLMARFDNLGKGASGAAVQNMNIILGLDETTSLNIN